MIFLLHHENSFYNFNLISTLNAQQEKYSLAYFSQWFEGNWIGSSVGFGGKSKIQHSYQTVMDGKFLQMKTNARFEKDDFTDVHEDLGIFSYDSDHGKLMLRQFFSEGFVNTYYLDTVTAYTDSLVFITESSESSGGMLARLIFVFRSEDAYFCLLELANPGQEFFSCQRMELERKKLIIK